MVFVDASHPQETALMEVLGDMKKNIDTDNTCDLPTCDLSFGFLPLQVKKGHRGTLAVPAMS